MSMYIIEVIPLTVLPPQVPQILSYFFEQTLPRGAVVEVVIQKKKVTAIVLTSVPLEQNKITLKKSAFQLKKISRVISEESRVSHRQLQIAHLLSRHYYAPLGLSLKTVLPPFFGKRGYQTITKQPIEEIPPDELSTPLPKFISVNANQTLAEIQPVIKEVIRKGGQVLFLSPDTATLGYFYNHLKDIAPSARLSSDVPNSDYYEVWKRITDGGCKLVCATRVGLFLPFRDLRLVIMEDPFHEMYKSDMSPRYNTPDVALKIASLNGAQTIFVSPIPSLNIQYAIEQKAFKHENRQSPNLAISEIVDIGYERKTGNFSLFSRHLQGRLLEAINSKKKILLFSSRRAHSGILICQNCETFIKCGNCEVPMRVHVTSEAMLVCYHCNAYQNFPRSCPNCHSTKLVRSGTPGSQKIREQFDNFLIEHKITGIEPLILDSDLIRNDIQERAVLKAIQAAPQQIVIATQMIFSHRYAQQYDLIAVVSADALMNHPDFRAEERFFYQYEKLLDFQPQRIIIQTFHPESNVINLATQNNYENFYKQEVIARKLLFYPPFSRLVKLNFSHVDKLKAAHAARLLNERLRMAIGQFNYGDKVKTFGPIPALITKERNRFVYTIILKINPELTELSGILRFVPTAWQIDIDPRQML